MASVLLRRWTREEYERMVAAGVFSPTDRVELLDGEILARTPQGSAHATAIGLVEAALRPLVPADHHIRTQRPFALDDRSEPEPDVAIVPGGLREYRDAHPTTARLIVEVSDTSLEYDRTHKLPLYARAGVPECWIVNLPDRLLEVYRNPIPAPSAGIGWTYHHHSVLEPADRISALAPPETLIAVADLLP